ncbi:MAG: response regulator [Sphingobacteriaceae bacterium]|nr:MAG: response regulator [Sphingobacteriaceae bacterium]
MCKLVMIDDNPMEHLIMERMFDKYGFFPDAAHSLDGSIIIDFLKKNHNAANLLPDVIFLDLNMPLFSGWDFLKEFEQLYITLKKKADIYVVSSSVDKEDKSRAERYPFVRSYLRKPVKRDVLEHIFLLHHPIIIAS